MTDWIELLIIIIIILSSSAGLNDCVDEIKEDKMGGACDTHEKRNLDRHVVEKSE
jgi:hypothetical protein